MDATKDALTRRRFLQGSGALAGMSLLSGCTKKIVLAGMPSAASMAGLPFYDRPGTIVPIRADMDRIFRITVCLRPFRAAGPRMDVEKIGDTTVVHNYGHGGSGWSLSWGCADAAVRKAMDAAPGIREIAVIGCGALGMTSAIIAQRMGMQVTIYAKERPPFVRSSRATGSWTPDSRIAFANAAPATFASDWERMARFSFSMYQSYLGAAGNPIEWTDRYTLQDDPGPAPERNPAEMEGMHEFLHLNDRIRDLRPGAQEMPPGSTPFPTKHVTRTSSLTFNVASYSRQLMEEFLVAGGKIETREFHAPSEIASLPQKVVIGCPGYGGRALWSDETITPVRGQIAWLIPQENVNYGVYYKNLYVLARRDGIVVQPGGDRGDDTGWNDTNEQPDRAEAEGGIRTLQELYARMEAMQKKRV